MTPREKLDARALELKLDVPKGLSNTKLAKLIKDAETGAPQKDALDVNGNAAAEERAAAEDGNTIIVVGPKNGRWRAGRHFTSQPVTIAVADLSEEEAIALHDDPLLAVSSRASE